MDKKGVHIISNFFGCKNSELLVDEKMLSQFLIKTVKENGMTVLKKYFHKFEEGGGITGYILLAESHVAIHTWPEKDNYLTFDIFVCNLSKDNTEGAQRIYEETIKAFRPEKKEEHIIERD